MNLVCIFLHDLKTRSYEFTHTHRKKHMHTNMHAPTHTYTEKTHMHTQTHSGVVTHAHKHTHAFTQQMLIEHVLPSKGEETSNTPHEIKAQKLLRWGSRCSSLFLVYIQSIYFSDTKLYIDSCALNTTQTKTRGDYYDISTWLSGIRYFRQIVLTLEIERCDILLCLQLYRAGIIQGPVLPSSKVVDEVTSALVRQWDANIHFSW